MAARVVPEEGAHGSQSFHAGPQLRKSSEIDLEARDRLLTRLMTSRVAGHTHKDLLTSCSKSAIKSVRVLGEGAFGIVDLVLIDVPDTLPLLCVRKKLLKQGEHNNNNPELEVEFLSEFHGNHFIVQLWSHVIGLYDFTLLLEYCPYGAMDNLLQIVSEARSKHSNACFTWFSDKVLGKERYTGFSEPEARFYIACCVLGLEAMHDKGILHRDIKPGNLLIAENGYVKLGDLGLCKRLGPNRQAHAHAGTPGYICPEMLHDKAKAGYSYPADIWSLGIMLWELVDGLPPRWAPMSWYFTVKLHFPADFSPELRSLLTGMLDKSPSTRMTLQQMKAHEWFKGFSWEQLAAQAMLAPRFPELELVHLHRQLVRSIGGESVF